MTADFSDERLSAYLDDELTPAERDEVEALLASSAEHRQLVEELRSLRQTMRELPRARLPDDFAERVLRRALSAAESGAETAAASLGSTSDSLDAPTSPRVSTPPSTAPSAAADVAAAGTPFAPWHVDGAADLAGGTSAAELALRQSIELRRWRRAFWAASTVAAGLAAVLVGGSLPPFQARPTAQFTGEPDATQFFSLGGAPAGASSPATASGPAPEFMASSSVVTTELGDAPVNLAAPADSSAADLSYRDVDGLAPGSAPERRMARGGRGDEVLAKVASDASPGVLHESAGTGFGAPGGIGGGLGGMGGAVAPEGRAESLRDGAGADQPARSDATSAFAARFARGVAATNGMPGAVGRGASPAEPPAAYFVRVVLPRESLDSAELAASFQNNGVVLSVDEQVAEFDAIDAIDARKDVTSDGFARRQSGVALRRTAAADSTAEVMRKRQVQQSATPGAAETAEKATPDAKLIEEQLALRFNRLDRFAPDDGDLHGDFDGAVEVADAEIDRSRSAGRLYHVRAPLDRIQNVLAELEERRADVNWFVPPSADSAESERQNVEQERRDRNRLRALAETTDDVRSDLREELRWDTQGSDKPAGTGLAGKSSERLKTPKSTPAQAAPGSAPDDRLVRSKPLEQRELKQSAGSGTGGVGAAEAGDKAKDERTAEGFVDGLAADATSAPQARRYLALSNKDLRDMAEQELLLKELQAQQGRAPAGGVAPKESPVEAVPQERSVVMESSAAGRSAAPSRPPEVERLLRSMVLSEPHRRGRTPVKTDGEPAAESYDEPAATRKSNQGLEQEKPPAPAASAPKPQAPKTDPSAVRPAPPSSVVDQRSSAKKTDSAKKTGSANKNGVEPPQDAAHKQPRIVGEPRGGERDRPAAKAAGGAPAPEAKPPAIAARPAPGPAGEKAASAAPQGALGPKDGGSDRKAFDQRFAPTGGGDSRGESNDGLYVDVYLWIETVEPAAGRGRADSAAEVPAVTSPAASANRPEASQESPAKPAAPPPPPPDGAQ